MIPVFTGSYFTRYELRDNYDDMGVSRTRFLEGDATFYRVRFGIGTGLIDVGNDLKVALQFSPQAAGVFGALGPNTVVDATLGLHEGFARVQGKYARFDAGRFELNYGDALLIGNLDWNETARSFDGVRARISDSPSSAWLDVFVTMIDEGRDPAPGAAKSGFGKGDIYFYGLYAGVGPAVMPGLDFDLYALGRSWLSQQGLRVSADPASPLYERKDAHELTLGARAKQKIAFFDYRAEAGYQLGKRPGAAPTLNQMTMMATGSAQKAVEVSAYHADVELGGSLGDTLRIGVEGIVATGDDLSTKNKNEGFDELYPTAHKWLGLADVFNQAGIKRTNVLSAVLHVTAKATKSLTLQADGHMFSRLEKNGAGKDGYAASEIDVGAVYTLAKGLKVRGLYAVVLPDSTFYPVASAGGMGGMTAGGVNPIHFAEVELRYDLVP